MKLNKFLLSMTVVGGIAAAQTLAPPGRNLTRRDGGSQVPDSTMTPPVSDSILPVVADSVAVQNAVNQAADSVDWDAVNWDSIYPSTMLGEVVVKAVKTAVIAKQDTMEYNAGSFKTATNANVEDLLKKLPGVEVGSDGSISSGGKTVTKILVDGKEFFGDDPTAATKNLPSDMIDKVQVVNRKSDLARLTGVDDGEEETVINLTVKKNMKNGWFGNAEAGYGTDGRYRYSFNVNRFQDGNQITILGGGNNVNQMGFADRGRGRFGSFGGNNGINSTQNIGINFNVGKGDRIRVGGNVVYSHSDRKTYEDRFTEYLDSSDSSSYQNSWQSTRDRGHNVYADFRLQWKIDSANTVDFRPRFVFSHRDMQRSDTSMLRAGDFDRTPVNRQENDIHTKGNSYDVSGNLIFNHNFLSHPGRSLSVQAKYSFSDQKDYQFSWAKLLYYLKQDDSEDLFRYVNNETWSSQVSGRVTWTEPLGDVKRGNFLTVAYNLDYRWNNADRITYSLDPTLFPGYLPEPSDGSPDGAVMDESLSNRFRNKYFNQELQVGYKKVARKYNLQAGVTFTPSSMSSTDLIDDAKNIPTRWVYNFAPFLRLQWKFDKSSSLRINYRARTSQPSMSKLQPVADISDPMNITIGNPDLKPSFSQSIMAHYNGFNTDAQRSIFAMVNASMISNNVVSKTVTDPTTGGRTTTYENMNGDWNIMAMGMVTQPFRNRNWRFSGRLMTRYSSSGGYINGMRNRSGNFSIAPEASLTFTHDLFQLSVGPRYSYQLTTATLESQANRSINSFGFDASGALYLPFGLELTTDLYMSRTTGYGNGYDNNQWLWNAQLSYSFLRNKQLTLSLSVYDILQQKKNISRTVNPTSIVDARINDLTRYAMVTLTWKFNSFGSQKDIPKIDGDDRPRRPESGRGHGGPGGPPPGGRF